MFLSGTAARGCPRNDRDQRPLRTEENRQPLPRLLSNDRHPGRGDRRHRFTNFGEQMWKKESNDRRDSRAALERLPRARFDRSRAAGPNEVPLPRRANRRSGFRGTGSVTLYSGRASMTFVTPITRRPRLPGIPNFHDSRGLTAHRRDSALS